MDRPKDIEVSKVAFAAEKFSLHFKSDIWEIIIVFRWDLLGFDDRHLISISPHIISQEAESELISHLSQDYMKEGYLHKTGPSPTDVYKKRW